MSYFAEILEATTNLLAQDPQVVDATKRFIISTISQKGDAVFASEEVKSALRSLVILSMGKMNLSDDRDFSYKVRNLFDQNREATRLIKEDEELIKAFSERIKKHMLETVASLNLSLDTRNVYSLFTSTIPVNEEIVRLMREDEDVKRELGAKLKQAVLTTVGSFSSDGHPRQMLHDLVMKSLPIEEVLRTVIADPTIKQALVVEFSKVMRKFLSGLNPEDPRLVKAVGDSNALLEVIDAATAEAIRDSGLRDSVTKIVQKTLSSPESLTSIVKERLAETFVTMALNETQAKK